MLRSMSAPELAMNTMAKNSERMSRLMVLWAMSGTT